jgi:trehalose 6-phosphate phosphatase
VGDDITDEDAFIVLGSGDMTVKVGHADTAAVNRLHDTDAVAQWLQRLAGNLADG